MAQTERSASDETLEGLRLLADETRWRLIQALRDGDHLVGELVDQTGLPQNLVSYHLGILRQAGLVRLHKSDADGRATACEKLALVLQRDLATIASERHSHVTLSAAKGLDAAVGTAASRSSPSSPSRSSP